MSSNLFVISTYTILNDIVTILFTHSDKYPDIHISDERSLYTNYVVLRPILQDGDPAKLYYYILNMRSIFYTGTFSAYNYWQRLFLLCIVLYILYTLSLF